MKRSIIFLVAFLLLPDLSFAKLLSDNFCFYCPPGSDLELYERDRYFCVTPGTGQTVAAPLWAKPVWSKSTSEGCPSGYISLGDGEDCYKCPSTYAFTSAVTDYRRGGESDRLVGKWVLAKLSFTHKGKTNHAKVGRGFMVVSFSSDRRVTQRMRGEDGKFMTLSGSWEYDSASRTLSWTVEGEKPFISKVMSVTDDAFTIKSGNEVIQTMGFRRE